MQYNPPTLQMYQDAGQYLTPFVADAAPTNPLCIICCIDRELDFSTERNTQSHIITNSVLHAFGSGTNSTRVELVHSRVIGFMEYSYKAFCKHRQNADFRSCEDCLNDLGERALPAFMEQFCQNNLNNLLPVNFNDMRIFHAITTIGWRILAVGIGQAGSIYSRAECDVAFRCLEYVRPLIRDASYNIDSKVAVMLHVVGQSTMRNWTELTGATVDETTRDTIMAPLITTISSGCKFVFHIDNNISIMHWNAVLGPLHIKYVFLDHCLNPSITVAATIDKLESCYTRVPSSGILTVLGFNDRPPLVKELLASDVLVPQARALALAFRSQPRHWLQQFSQIEVLVPMNYGRFEEDVDTINISVDQYRILVGNYNLYAHTWNPQIRECRIYQVGRSMILFAEFYVPERKVLCAGRITRSAAHKYARIDALRDVHADYLEPHQALLLDMLRHIDPLNDEQLPPPAPPVTIQHDFADDMDGDDAFGGLFG